MIIHDEIFTDELLIEYSPDYVSIDVDFFINICCEYHPSNTYPLEQLLCDSKYFNAKIDIHIIDWEYRWYNNKTFIILPIKYPFDHIFEINIFDKDFESIEFDLEDFKNYRETDFPTIYFL